MSACTDVSCCKLNDRLSLSPESCKLNDRLSLSPERLNSAVPLKKPKLGHKKRKKEKKKAAAGKRTSPVSHFSYLSL